MFPVITFLLKCGGKKRATGTESECVTLPRTTKLLAIGIVAGLFSFPFMGAETPCDPCKPVVLGVQLRPQQKPKWCWAACGEMIMLKAGRNPRTISQCIQASKSVAGSKRTNCCDRAADCDFTSWPVFDRFGFTFMHTSDSAIGWEQLVEEIKAGRPLCGAIKWSDSARDTPGHMFVVDGYCIKEDGDRWIHILDPEPTPIPDAIFKKARRGGDDYWMKWQDFQGASRAGVKQGWSPYTHWDDYYSIVAENS